MEKGSSEGEVGDVLVLLVLLLFELLGWEWVLVVEWEWEPERFNRVDVVVDVGKVICG